jgi:alkanesulfonate monooxygenase SsuD/methylene tetrahydromethanopterin reductase-like flavin-dependent oxidoreductase (luciferase family)
VDGVRWQAEQAQIRAIVGETEAALEQLARLVKLPGGSDYGDLRFNPIWEPIRNDPRFQQIMAEASVPPKYD